MVRMELYWYIAFFVLGTIIGSFLNVVLYRLHTGKSLGGRSHCMTCGKVLSWYELLPVVSYLFQGGACRGCAAYIPPRYLVVELLTGFSFLLVFHLFSGNLILLVLYLFLASLLILIVVYDIRHTIIPDELTLAVGVAALVFILHEWKVSPEYAAPVSRLFSGAGAALFFYGLWHVSSGRWIGLGDAKLALPLGIMVGAGGVFSMVVLSFWIGAGVSLVLLGIQRVLARGKTRLRFLGAPRTMKSEVPFAPFLVLGFLAVQFFHANIFDITYLLFW